MSEASIFLAVCVLAVALFVGCVVVYSLYILYGIIYDKGYRHGWKDAHDIIAEERRVLRKARGDK